MSTAAQSQPSGSLSSANVAERVRSLQLGKTERKTAEFGLRGVFWLVLLAGVAGGVYWLSQQQERPELALALNWLPIGKTTYEVVPVKVEGGEEVILDLTGYITPKTKVNVSARVPGLVQELNFIEGDRIEAGQILAKLDDSTFQADYAQAVAAEQAALSGLLEMNNGALPEEIDQARTAVDHSREVLKMAQKNFSRTKTLKQENIATAVEFEQAESVLSDAKANLKTMEHKLKIMEDGPREERIKRAEAEVAQARAMVAKAKTNLENATITSPIAGVVLERHGEVGENIRPDALAAGLYVLADLKQLEVNVDVEEQSLGKLRVGQPCRIIPDAYSDRSYAAKISRWQPQVNRARAVVRVILTITEPDEYLLAEMNCRAVILESETPEPETLWIPVAALVPMDEKPAVFVVDTNLARQRPVVLGETRGDVVQIVDGLTKTDRVVLPGQTPPVNGQKVQ